MTNNNPLLDAHSPEYKALARDAICVCLRHEHASAVHEIDWETEAYSAINALVDGRSLNDALAMISPEHPFAHKLRAEIIKVAGRLADRPLRA